MQMIFEDVQRGPVARREIGAQGEKRTVDGQRFFDLAGAVGHFTGWTEQGLRELYCETFAEAALEQASKSATDATGETEIKADKPLTGPLTAAADATLRHFVYGYLDDGEFECFLRLCQENQFSPWTRDVIPVVETDGGTGDTGARKVQYITTIGYLRKVATRHADYDGQLGPFWCGDDGDWKDVWTAEQKPSACKVGVKRKGSETIVWGVVRWNELGIDGSGLPAYYEEKPCYMSGIRAEATALRRAYPEASRLYLREELAGDRTREPSRGDVRSLPVAMMPVDLPQVQPPPRYREEQRDDGRKIVYDEPEYDYYAVPRPARRRMVASN